MMFHRQMFVWTCGALAALSVAANGQGFDSGSDGSYGPIVVPSGTTLTIDLEADAPDGIINATTIIVESNATLRFSRNPLNTPVYLLAQDDILVSGLIDVSGADGSSNPPIGGAGGPGGFDGGDPGFGSENPPGDGHGPGAGRGGNDSAGDSGAGGGAYGDTASNSSASDGSPYGSPLLVPLAGGSGGGGRAGQPGTGGGGGGGAILLSSNTRIHVTGEVRAQGGRGFAYNQGSGGAIRAVAPDVSGTGVLQVRGGGWNDTAGHGRIRIDTINRRNLRINFQPASAVSLGGFMAAFPDVVPRLDLVEVAGETIPLDQPEPVEVLLPFGSTGQRTVVVRAAGFPAPVDINVVLVPDSGPSTTYPATIDMKTDPDIVTVDVEFPVNRTTRVWAWTR